MNRHEFLTRLADALNGHHVTDAADIVSEYEQHFAFKKADGFSEEEIAAKLGDPVTLAAQFEENAAPPKRGPGTAVTAAGLGTADLFAGPFFVLLSVWNLAMAVFTLVCAAGAVLLAGGWNIRDLIPPVPGGIRILYGFAMAALAILSAAGTVYFAAFLRQIARSYGRFHHNTMAAASGRPVLPSRTLRPQLRPRAGRRLRTVSLISLALFCAALVLSFLLSMLVADAWEFWHAWGWFGYSGP